MQKLQNFRVTGLFVFTITLSIGILSAAIFVQPDPKWIAKAPNYSVSVNSKVSATPDNSLTAELTGWTRAEGSKSSRLHFTIYNRASRLHYFQGYTVNDFWPSDTAEEKKLAEHRAKSNSKLVSIPSGDAITVDIPVDVFPQASSRLNRFNIGFVVVPHEKVNEKYMPTVILPFWLPEDLRRD